MTSNLAKTAMYELHVKAGARIVEFAGWLMPIWFSSIAREHRAVRTAVGMFDVSHMGQILVSGPDAVKVVDYLVTNSVAALPEGRALYTVALNSRGGIVDDLIVYKRSNTNLLLCVNAATTAKDFRHFSDNNPGSALIENVSRFYSLIAVQGSRSYDVLAAIWPEVAARLSPFNFVEFRSHGSEIIISGTGYTGERGFELFTPWDSGSFFWELLMEAGREWGIVPVGLGARDTLRLEACFCLYGNDITEDTNPIEAGLKWTVNMNKDFLGREALIEAQTRGISRKLVGFEMLDRGIPRQHYSIFRGEEKVGEVTSGNMSPTLSKGIGMGYVQVPYHKRGTELDIEIRGKRARGRVVKTPFYKAVT